MFTETDNADIEQGFYSGDYTIHGCCKLCAAERCTISRKIESCWFSVCYAIVPSCWNHHQMLLLSLHIIDQILIYLTADNNVTHFTCSSPALYSLELLSEMNIFFYTGGCSCILMTVVVERRLPWIHTRLSWLRRKNDQFFTYSLFEDEDAKQFQTHETLQIPFLIITLLATMFTVFIYLKGDAREVASFRIGQLILVNLIFLCLLSSRHSVFLELAAAYQAEYLWAHKILGFITLAESVVFAGLRFQGRGSRFIGPIHSLIIYRVPQGMAWHFGRYLFCHKAMSSD